MSFSKLDKKNTYELLKNAERMYELALKHGETRNAKITLNAFRELHENGNPHYIYALQKLRRMPVLIDEFLESNEFLGEQIEIWPALKESICTINPDILAGEKAYNEALFLGASGCHAKGSPILMADGAIKNVEDIQVGEFLMGPDSKPREVLSLARGREQMVRIIPKKGGGEPFVVNRSHIMPLKLNGKYTVMKISDYLAMSTWKKQHTYLYRQPVEYPERDLIIDPYFLGLWLGDGTSRHSDITTVDKEIADYVYDIALQRGLKVRVDNNGSKADTYHVTDSKPRGGMYHQNNLKRDLDTLNLRQNKHIPDIYLKSSRSQRLQLLAGLIDTDGSKNCGGYEITQKRELLADQIVILARSLGFKTSKAIRVINNNSYYRIHIYGDLRNVPVLLERKKIRTYNNPKNPLVSSFSVEELEEDDYYGFSISGDKLYLDAEFRVNHNTGKSVRAMVTNLYQLYLVDCFDWPQEMYKLSRPTELVFMFTSIKPTTAEKVLYKPFRQYFTQMSYVKKYVEYNKDIESELILNQNKVVRAASANVNSLVAHAIMSGIVDEINFFARVQNSKQTPDGSVFDQAEIIHRTIKNRRKSRFTTEGPNPGVICISAQTRYKGDFTDRRIDQIKKTKEDDVIFFREKRYEVWPKEKLRKETFKILVGCDEYPTRILDETASNYVLPRNAHVEEIPMNFYDDFQRDPEYALREIVGISTNAITPFIAQRQKIYEAIAPWNARELKPWTTESNYKLNEYSKLNDNGMPVIIDENLPKDGKPRYIHVDLSVVQDRCGIAISHIDGYMEVGQEKLPFYVVDWVVTLEPDSLNQVDVAQVRRWVVDLKLKYGVNIARVTYDGFQSIETIQQLRKLGINAMNISVDKTLEPYENLKSALYTDRLALPDNDLLKQELAGLELNMNANNGKGKVDHTPLMGKDSADACTGAVYNASLSADSKQNSGYVGRVTPRPTVGKRPSSKYDITI